MDLDNLTRAATAALAFAALFGGHYAGDQWLQTSGQACKKSLARAGGARLEAHWHCAKHVMVYSLAGLTMFLVAALWLDLPVRPGWIAAGIALNAITHYIADLRTPLLWMARVIGRQAYVEHCQVVRPTGAEMVGPGTASFELDQAWHFIWIFFSALLFAGA
jgi:hypothetical protein